MTRVRWQERVAIAPDLHHGEPRIKRTRIPVAVIVGSLADGVERKEILDAYPQLTVEDIQAALDYVAAVSAFPHSVDEGDSMQGKAPP